jgi:hypothetical protein
MLSNNPSSFLFIYLYLLHLLLLWFYIYQHRKRATIEINLLHNKLNKSLIDISINIIRIITYGDDY